MPNNSNTIGIIIFLLMILNKPKSDNIITIAKINVFITFIFFKLLPPNKNNLLNFLQMFRYHVFIIDEQYSAS